MVGASYLCKMYASCGLVGYKKMLQTMAGRQFTRRKPNQNLNFKTKPTFTDVDEYLVYKEKVTDFIKRRNKRIANYVNQLTTEQNTSH